MLFLDEKLTHVNNIFVNPGKNLWFINSKKVTTDPSHLVFSTYMGTVDQFQQNLLYIVFRAIVSTPELKALEISALSPVSAPEEDREKLIVDEISLQTAKLAKDLDDLKNISSGQKKVNSFIESNEEDDEDFNCLELVEKKKRANKKKSPAENKRSSSRIPKPPTFFTTVEISPKQNNSIIQKATEEVVVKVKRPSRARKPKLETINKKAQEIINKKEKKEVIDCISDDLNEDAEEEELFGDDEDYQVSEDLKNNYINNSNNKKKRVYKTSKSANINVQILKNRINPNSNVPTGFIPSISIASTPVAVVPSAAESLMAQMIEASLLANAKMEETMATITQIKNELLNKQQLDSQKNEGKITNYLYYNQFNFSYFNYILMI